MILHAGFPSHCCKMPTPSDVFLSFSCSQNTFHSSQIVTLLNGITLKPCVKHLLLTELLHSIVTFNSLVLLFQSGLIVL